MLGKITLDKRRIMIYMSWIMVLLCMLMIFMFSAQNGTESDKTSSSVVKTVLKVVMKEEDITPTVIKKYHLPIRKIAHFGIFMLLGYTLSNAMNITFKKPLWFNLAFAVGISALYAISDEFHQMFSDKRFSSPIDVMIDTGGAIAGMLVYLSIVYILKYIRNKKGWLKPKY